MFIAAANDTLTNRYVTLNKLESNSQHRSLSRILVGFHRGPAKIGAAICSVQNQEVFQAYSPNYQINLYLPTG